jgi:hypothetical protein
MTTYIVNGKMTVACWTEVEANSPEEAVEIARKRDVAEIEISLSYPEDECWNLNNGGTPFDISAEVA